MWVNHNNGLPSVHSCAMVKGCGGAGRASMLALRGHPWLCAYLFPQKLLCRLHQ